MSVPPIDISAEQWGIVADILNKHVPNLEVWAFGSRVTGKARKYSDLDLAFITQEPMSLGLYGDLKEDFSESDLPFRVDILDWASTSDSFRRIVERDKVVIQPPARDLS
jgi:predicted nucleotidyltransferase